MAKNRPRLRALWLPRRRAVGGKPAAVRVGGGGGGGGSSRRRRGRGAPASVSRSQGDGAGSLGHGAAAVTAGTGPPAPQPQPRPRPGGRAPSAYEAAASSKADRRRRGWWPWRGRGRVRGNSSRCEAAAQGATRRGVGRAILGGRPAADPRLAPASSRRESQAAAAKKTTAAVIYGLENFLANTMLLRARQGGCTAAPRPRPSLSPCSHSPAGNTDAAAPGSSAQPHSLECAVGEWSALALTPKLLRRLSAPPQDPSEGSARAAPVLRQPLSCPPSGTSRTQCGFSLGRSV